jgi:hypothetical protein
MLEKIKRNYPIFLLVFVLGDCIGATGAYYTIAKDCAVMRYFRFGDVAYSCTRLMVS